jgi:hypothetical protein
VETAAAAGGPVDVPLPADQCAAGRELFLDAEFPQHLEAACGGVRRRLGRVLVHE